MGGGGRPRVIDTNIPKIANGGQPQAGPDCEEACIHAILDVTRKGLLVLDDKDIIFGEYRRQLSLKGQPGVGDMFMKWVHENRATPGRCCRVALRSPREPEDEFHEFPPAPDLQSFDRSDRKFVAVAVAHGGNPPIQVAVDRGWWDHRDALAREGVRVEFLCRDDIRRASRKEG